MSYESDPAELGVGKRYGPLHLGGSNGKKGTGGSDDEVVFFVTTEELTADDAQAISIPPYSEVVSVWYKVDDAFGTGDAFDIDLGGNSILATGTPVSVAVAGIFDPALHATAGNIQTGATAEDLVIDTALIDNGALGSMKVVVTIKQL